MTDFLSAVGLSLLLGSIIGLERQWHRRLVDLKTNALVSLGATLFMLVTRNSGGEHTETVRMAAQIVVGVGFLGGGLLYREGSQTKGINTAATLWCCAAVGTLCGLGRFQEASVASMVIVSANTVLRWVARYLNLKMGIGDSLTDAVRFEIDCDSTDATAIQSQVLAIFHEKKIDVRSASRHALEDGLERLSITVYFEHADFAQQAERVMLDAPAWKARTVNWTRL